MSTTTEAIKSRLNIVEIVGQYVRLQKAGNHWKANCPFHQEKTPSFTVSEERNMWHCFGCGKGGDVFAFLMEIEGIEFREALATLAERAGVELPQYSKNSEQTAGHKSQSLEILELSTKFYEQQLWDGKRGQAMLAYLHARGLSDESIRSFRIGYAPDGWRFLLDFLVKRGFAVSEIEQAGLIIQKNQESRIKNQELSHSLNHDSQFSTHHSQYYDRFRDRIMFPIGDILGRMIGYSARVAPGGDESQAKYVNTPETEVYHKSRVLYGIHLAKKAMKESGRAVLVEGNVDVIALHQVGIPETVAVSGTALTVEQLALIKRYVNKVMLFFDMDSAGQKAAWKSTVLAQEMGLMVEIIALDQGKDAADMGETNPEGLRTMLTRGVPAMEYFLGRLLALHAPLTPEHRHQIVEAYAELLASITNELDRAHWTKTLAERIGSEAKIVRATIEALPRMRSQAVAFRASTNRQPFLPKSFKSRAEMLREEIVGLMLVGDTVRLLVLERAAGPLRDFLSLHPLFFFLQNEKSDSVGTMEDTHLQQEASRLLFQTLSLPAFSEVEETLRSAKAEAIAEEYLTLLPQALALDERRSLAQRIEAARTANDKDEEKRLLEEFAKQARQ